MSVVGCSGRSGYIPAEACAAPSEGILHQSGPAPDRAPARGRCVVCRFCSEIGGKRNETQRRKGAETQGEEGFGAVPVAHKGVGKSGGVQPAIRLRAPASRCLCVQPLLFHGIADATRAMNKRAHEADTSSPACSACPVRNSLGRAMGGASRGDRRARGEKSKVEARGGRDGLPVGWSRRLVCAGRKFAISLAFRWKTCGFGRLGVKPIQAPSYLSILIGLFDNVTPSAPPGRPRRGPQSQSTASRWSCEARVGSRRSPRNRRTSRSRWRRDGCRTTRCRARILGATATRSSRWRWP